MGDEASARVPQPAEVGADGRRVEPVLHLLDTAGERLRGVPRQDRHLLLRQDRPAVPRRRAGLEEGRDRHGDPALRASAARRPLDCLERVVGDYLAGMTDRYAQLEYRRLFLPAAEL